MSEPENNLNPPAQEQDNPPSPAPDAPLSPGAKLAAGRQERGWTVEQVAAHLKLAPRQVLAIESDDYAALPGMPIVRGFIRSYAKLLRIDAAPLLEQVGGAPASGQESLKPQQDLATPFAGGRVPSMSEKPGLSFKWIVGVLLLVLVAAAIWALQNGARDVDSPPQAVTAEQEPAGVVEEPLPEVASDGDTPPGADPVQPEPPAATPAAPGAVPPPVTAAPARDAAAATQTPAAGPNQLTLRVREESWIEVRRAGGGNPLFARLARAGEDISVEVNEPVVLVVGNAAGVDVALRGEPVALRASTTSNVARVTLK